MKRITRKHTIIASIIIFILTIAISILLLIIDIANSFDLDNNSYIFESVSDLNFLDEYIVKDDISDKANDYTERKCVKVKYNKEFYIVYAYVFKTPESAFEYVYEKTGNNYQSWHENNGETNFRYSSASSFLGLFTHRETMILSKNKVLIIEGTCGPIKYSEFLSFVIGQLPEKVEYTQKFSIPFLKLLLTRNPQISLKG